MPAHKKWPPGTRDGSDRSDRRGGNGAKTVAQNPPPTRAGGQDDGSLNKLPQIKNTCSNICFIPVTSYVDSFKGLVNESGILGMTDTYGRRF